MPAKSTYAFDVEGHTVVYNSMEAFQKDQDKIVNGQTLIVDESFEHHVENKTRKEYLNRTFPKKTIFELFKGLALGETIAITMTLMAQLYIMLPGTSLCFLTMYPYWGLRTIGTIPSLFLWTLMGMLFSWGWDQEYDRKAVIQ